MSSDSGIQVKLPAQRQAADRARVAPLEKDASLKAPEPPLWTGDQLTCLGVQALLIASLFIGMLLFKGDYLSMLWTHPMGVRMLLGSLALTAFNFGLYLFLCAILNRVFPVNQAEVERRREVLFTLLLGVHFVVFTLPVIFVLLVGPAAITIAENLR